MTAKSFFWICTGLSLLACAHRLGAQSANAGLVDYPPSRIAAVYQSNKYLSSTGEVYDLIVSSGQLQWIRQPLILDPPVPVSEIRFWQEFFFVTFDDTVYYLNSTGEWVTAPPFPGSQPINIEAPTWTDVKNGYREKEE